jgi:GT2 family glycosyltransferase/glycosyltransferase involved in cell wall biosynthesis
MNKELQEKVDLIRQSDFFDEDWYREQFPDVAASRLDPIVHYVKYGSKIGRNPSPSFKSNFDTSKLKEVADQKINLLLYNSTVIKKREHHIHQGGEKRSDLKTDIDLISSTSLFDRHWYLSEYRDVAKNGVDPISHYVRYGAREGRDPGPRFSTKWYIAEYNDVLISGLNPLVHYLRLGQWVGRSPMPPAPAVELWWSRFMPDLRTRARENKTNSDNKINVIGALARMVKNQHPVSIIVPVYNASDEVDDCLQSLLCNTKENYRIIVINDASPDLRIHDILDRYQGINHLEIYHNDENIGFTRTINRGIDLAGRSDVVFLNSDTKVTPGWLRNLRVAVYSEERIGTATPLSNNAGAFSVPEIGKQNSIPLWMSLDNYARAITQISLRAYPRVPTGNGYCIYVRRECIDEVGVLDSKAFPMGYGEENDFCMRALRRGWSHIVDDATLIYHVRSASFGEAKKNLIKRGRAVIDKRYPDYTYAIRIFISCERLKAVRERVRITTRIITSDQGIVKPRVLFVLSTRTGGTPQTNQDLMSALDDRIEAFVLRCDSFRILLMSYKDGVYVDMERHTLSEPIKAFPHRSNEYDAVVASWLVQYAIELVHIRHIAWHGLGLIDVSKLLGLPVIFSFHDFYTACPTVKLLDDQNKFCAGKCTVSNGQCMHELWSDTDFPPLKNAAIEVWRKQFMEILEKCDLFVTTTYSAKNVLLKNYNFLTSRTFHVIPHGRDFDRFEQLASPIRSEETMRILVPGNISKAKGIDIVTKLGRVAAEKRIEIHVLGTVSKDEIVSADIICHGAYERSRFANKVREIRPHVGGVFSIWPETYCHTLTELWACGIPVIGFDFGAVGERIRESRAGWLTAEPSAEGVLEIIETIRTRVNEYSEKLLSVKTWQDRYARHHDCRYMSHAYFALYQSVMIGLTPTN